MSNPYTANVVIDLEFTFIPKKLRTTGLVTEIIEVGAVKVLSDLTVADEFSRMVKPTIAPGVSGSVHHVTGIGNEDLTCARTLPEVLDEFCAWIGDGRVRIVTWSGADLHQIETECATKGIEHHLPTRWLDIQRLYPRLMGTRRKRLVALSEAADWCGISCDHASAHRALYDAQITTELFLMMARGECAAHRDRIARELHSTRTGSLSSSIADRCSSLADLFATLKAQEAQA